VAQPKKGSLMLFPAAPPEEQKGKRSFTSIHPKMRSNLQQRHSDVCSKLHTHDHHCIVPPEDGSVVGDSPRRVAPIAGSLINAQSAVNQ
jgi:hypothetical protein